MKVTVAVLVLATFGVQVRAETAPEKPPAPPPDWEQNNPVTNDDTKPPPRVLPIVQTPKKPSQNLDERMPDATDDEKAIIAGIRDALKVGEKLRLQKIDDLREQRDKNPRQSDKIDAEIKKLKAAKGHYLPPFEFKLGSFGVPAIAYKVIQVVDRQNMIVEGYNDKWLWITHYSTEGISDGDDIVPDGLLYYAGTKQYTTVLGGTKTVHKISVLSNDELSAIVAKIH